MAYTLKLDENGAPVHENGLVTLVNEENKEEVTIDPAARHFKCSSYEIEEPAKKAASKKLKDSLAVYEKMKEDHPDLYTDPSATAAALKELETLKEKGEDVDERVKALHLEYGEKIETMKSSHETAITEKDNSFAELQKKMQMQQYLIPWASSEQLDGYLLPKDPTMLASILLNEVGGKKIEFNNDGTVTGWNGEPLIDYSNNQPITDPEKVLETILTTHPLRDKIKLSSLPAGGGMGGRQGGGAGSDIEKHFNPKTRNLTEQLKVKDSNPVLYKQMIDKFA